MKAKVKKHLINIALMIFVLGMTFTISLLLDKVLAMQDHTTALFVFAVFLVSILTDGYPRDGEK